jgi:hypothetical protein
MSASPWGDLAGGPQPGSSLCEKPIAGFDLDDAPELEVAHRRAPIAKRRQCDRHAGGFEPGHRGPGPVDRIDDQHVDRVVWCHQPPILGVVREPRGAPGEELLERTLGELVDCEGHIAACAVS